MDADRIKGNGVFSLSEWEELVRQIGLSPRQSQVVDLLFKGLGDKQIAAQLGISVHTLRTYFDRMFAKMDVGDRCELIVRVFSEFRSGCDPTGCPRQR